MKIAGFGCLNVKTEKDAKWFLDMYEISHWQMIVDYQTFRVTDLKQTDFKYVVFLEAGGGVNRVIQLGEKDFVRVYAQEGLERCGISNTDGMAFVRCYEHNGQYDYNELAMFCLQNSPYDLKKDDESWEHINEDNGEEIATDLIQFLDEGHDCTMDNTLYITEL